jgi:predicted nucleic acid-binding protein
VLFGHHTVDKTIDEHLREIAEYASDSHTLVFLDTNILAYLYKLHAAARKEFFTWSDGLLSNGRLVIPAWSASEYLSQVTGKTLESYAPKTKPAQVKNSVDALWETASLFVDDELLAKVGIKEDRATYLTGFRTAIDTLEHYLRAFSHQFDPGVIHQQVVDHLSKAILNSDLGDLCSRAAAEGASRFEHRLPPGFRDDAKGENRLGDLIIWMEILAKAKESARQYKQVLFITNDEKSDWVYAPKMRREIVASTRKSIGNSDPQIKLADPRLVSEFVQKTECQSFAICNLPTLVEGLSKIDATGLAQLAAAIQVDTESTTSTTIINSKLASGEKRDSAGPTEFQPVVIDTPSLEVDTSAEAQIPPNAEAGNSANPLADTYSLEALQDSLYEVDAPLEINAIIRALKSHNWYTQNPAIQSIQKIRQENFPPSSWFVLGRNIYQAACGNSQKAMEFMNGLENQLELFPSEAAQHILAGMLFEIYFDAQGDLRRTTKFSYADKPLLLVTKNDYKNVRAFICSRLYSYQNQYKFMPGDHVPMELRVSAVPLDQAPDSRHRNATHELHSVTLGEIELLRPTTDHVFLSTTHSLLDFGMSLRTLKTAVSEDLSIPKWALTVQSETPVDAQLVRPAGRELWPRLALESGG